MNMDMKKFARAGSIEEEMEIRFNEPERRLLNRGVVVEVICDLSNLIEAERLRLQKMASLTPPSLFESCPRNAIIVRLIDDGKDHFQIGNARLCYPLFPPHLCLPVKAGEQVFVLDPTPEILNDIMYWVARVPEADFVDDINFTHADRRMMESYELMDEEFAPPNPGYPNGYETPDTTTLREVGEEAAYEVIFTGSMANKSCTFEPVPRFTKRPGDLALQGSNNTLICLGQNRGWTKNKPATPAETLSNATVKLDPTGLPLPDSEIPPESGAIDIVAGRSPVTAVTTPAIIKNDREFEEVNKNPVNYDKLIEGADGNLLFNPVEGDPAFVEDLSRVYLSMKMDGDENFALEYSTVADFIADPVVQKPYVVMKSDEVRIIGRQEGSIRFVKEGDVGDTQCVITMQADGTVAIDAKKIIIGDGMRDGVVYLGAGATEPVMQGAKLETALHALADTILGEADALGTPNAAHPVYAAQLPIFKTMVTEALSAKSFTK